MSVKLFYNKIRNFHTRVWNEEKMFQEKIFVVKLRHIFNLEIFFNFLGYMAIQIKLFFGGIIGFLIV